jgi:ABC-2 type transport system ATP-binding protein
MAAIEITNLTKRFGETLAVDHLSLAIDAGVFFTFLGPNGAGKTTTMKLMAGLLHPSGGSVRIDGLDVQRSPREVKARIGYLPDHPYLYGKLTGWEFLSFIGGLYGLSTDDVATEGDKLIALFDLEDRVSRLIDTYSHGMRQRLAFAACFLHRPRVVIIDEPWVGLDPRNIRNTIEFLKRKADEGTTIFMSTHSLAVAQEVASRVGILHRGRLIFDGQVGELSGESTRDIEEVFLQMTEEGDAVGGSEP